MADIVKEIVQTSLSPAESLLVQRLAEYLEIDMRDAMVRAVYACAREMLSRGRTIGARSGCHRPHSAPEGSAAGLRPDPGRVAPADIAPQRRRTTGLSTFVASPPGRYTAGGDFE